MKNLFAMVSVIVEYMVLRPILAPIRRRQRQEPASGPLQSIQQTLLSTE